MAWHSSFLRAVVAGALTLGGIAAAAQKSNAPNGGPDAQMQSDVMKALDRKPFQDVTASVQDAVVKLSGNVATYADKEEADHRAHHRRGVSAVDNEIQVAGAEVDDRTLTARLGERLEYDRVGYGTTAFNAITLAVHNGVVTLGGEVYGPPDKDSALSLVANYPGVKDIVDNIEIAPLSPHDDRIRVAEFRTIYSFPTLSRYAMDPAKPIRIAVVNGKVTLMGLVDSEQDKDAAGIRANTVAGVFRVTNDLQVANPQVGKR